MPTTLSDRFIKSLEPPEKGKRIILGRSPRVAQGLRASGAGQWHQVLCPEVSRQVRASSESRPSASTPRPGA
ncbi:MAG: hypothetical protein MZV65_41835 [Chromatiales bacterium]|nr:hypothetical protein [Chromatiales bacterium]